MKQDCEQCSDHHKLGCGNDSGCPCNCHRTQNDTIFYNLGYRDAIANVLAEYKDKVKLPDLANFYKDKFEEHFSHNWHISD